MDGDLSGKFENAVGRRIGLLLKGTFLIVSPSALYRQSHLLATVTQKWYTALPPGSPPNL